MSTDSRIILRRTPNESSHRRIRGREVTAASAVGQPIRPLARCSSILAFRRSQLVAADWPPSPIDHPSVIARVARISPHDPTARDPPDPPTKVHGTYPPVDVRSPLGLSSSIKLSLRPMMACNLAVYYKPDRCRRRRRCRSTILGCFRSCRL